MGSLGWVRIQYDWCPYKKGNWDTEAWTQGEQHVKKVEIMVMLLQAKEHQR